MSILEGAYWISSQKHKKYLKADADCTVHGVDPGPRGIEILDSASLRARIWLIERTTDWKSFRLRNYETGFALDIRDGKVNDKSPVVVTRGSTQSQLWSLDKDAGNHIINLTNAKTNTSLISREYELFGTRKKYTVSTALNGNIDWKIHTGSQPPLFWVTIQHSSGAFLAQANDRSISLSRGAMHFSDHAVQWRFIMIGNDLRYVIVNRATGFVLSFDYTKALASSYNNTIYLGAKEEVHENVDNHWMLDVSGDGCIVIVHVGSKYSLAVYGTDINSDCYCYCTSHSPSSNAAYSSWVFTPAYDNLPSFALVNLHTGRCLADKPDPEIGTVSFVDEVNDFRSQWLFYNPSPNSHSNPSYLTYALLSKVSGVALEQFTATRIEGHHYYNYNNAQNWRFTPLHGGLIALFDSSSRRFLDLFFQGNEAIEPSPYNDHTPCWYLVSHRELGFDFITLDLDISRRLLPYIPNRFTTALSGLTQGCVSTWTHFRKGNEKYKYVTRTSRNIRATNETLRAVLSHLIGQWVEDTISQTRQPGTVISTTRENVEKLWDVCLSQRSFRRCSDEPGWVRIDLEGIYDVGGSWKANILGQWLDKPMFQAIIPADIHVGRTVIQRAMLQSLNQELTISSSVKRSKK